MRRASLCEFGFAITKMQAKMLVFVRRISAQHARISFLLFFLNIWTIKLVYMFIASI